MVMVWKRKSGEGERAWSIFFKMWLSFATCVLAALSGVKCVPIQFLFGEFDGWGPSRSVFSYGATQGKTNTSQYADDLTRRY